MKKMCWMAAACLCLLLAGCGKGSVKDVIPKKKLEGNSLYVKKVENLPEDFICGMDASSVLAEEASGVVYRNYAGEEQDVFQTLAEAGVNTIRVRVWNDPFDAQGNGFGGGNCNIDTAVEIGKRATGFGMSLLVDFHYSDFWADPNKQMCPRAWEGMAIEEKTEAAYQYTKECLEKLKKAGVKVRMVQVGNETNGALAGETKWFDIQYIMQAGAKATREVFPKALVAVHFANPETAGRYMDYAKKLDYYQVDYDVFASSYYPFWHGTLENLGNVLSEVAQTYGKKTLIVETSYAYTGEDTDFSGNTIGDGSAVVKNYPYTVQGQANSVRDVFDVAANHAKDCLGVVYWEGTWISVGGSSWEENSALWEKYGSGWASSYAAAYDPDDAGKYYGGSAVDNQAMFDAEGKPLESLQVFNLIRYGNEVPVKADALEDTYLEVDLNGTIAMPEKVNAVMNDGSKQEVPVTWKVTDAELQKMYEGGPAKYEIAGEAEGMQARCYLSMVEYNFLENPGFEDGSSEGWFVEDRGGADQIYAEEKGTDSLSGTWHMHFWSAKPGTVDFNLMQLVRDLPAGDYRFEISIMGGDAGETEIYPFVMLGGEMIRGDLMEITWYNDWHTGGVAKFTVPEGELVTVGLHVKCAGEGNGAWGKIDDAKLNSVSE
ncbi:MAG: glycosyl hydrolase 53 family protein [Lachnospiraceae bacterium]|nr:glycosyl hydrolase 53 family protein [Lachnospiraceae bacterium]